MATTQRPLIAALETTFTPPAACFTTLEAYIDRNTVLLVPLGITATQSSYYGCWPPGYQQFAAANTGTEQGYYSPGVCPSGFTSACAVSAAGPESAALCCPRSVFYFPSTIFIFTLLTGARRNYACTAGATGVYAGMSCKSTIAATTTITAYTPNLLQSAWQSDRTVVVPTGETTLALGYGIEVRWQSSDLSVFAGATRTGSTSSSSTRVPSSTPTPTPAPALTPAVPHANTATPAISPSTKLALGLGIPIVVILLGLILAALLLIRRRRQQKQHPKPYAAAAPAPTPPPAELQGDDRPMMVEPKTLKVELNARTPSPVEIDGTRVVVDQRVSGTYTISPVGTHFVGPDDVRVRRSPPSHHRRSGSGSVARTPSSVRRSSDDRMAGRRPAPTPTPVPVLVRKGTTPESSASEEEREIAERYRMFTTS